ncbi:hypothetical protein DH2020_000090 [Rehmannia glutinosa]|uniref:Dirigent protein n=1 Tax=Rehmannia glutinosa TaxID=99300 RepID=A0ABR0XVR6_REHGL
MTTTRSPSSCTTYSAAPAPPPSPSGHRRQPAVGAKSFAKPNGAVLPVNNGIPTNNANGGIANNNNISFLTGLSVISSNTFQTNNNNNIIGGTPGFPVLNSAQFPSGTTLQKLMFGTMTVFDDELTEGHDLGSGLVGKAQGFYISSSEDGTSQTMAFTVMFTSGSYADSLSFLGVHRTAVAESHLAVMGGTGKYVNAKGFATNLESNACAVTTYLFLHYIDSSLPTD